MEDLITKLQDLNRIDPLHKWNILIRNDGGFNLYGADTFNDELEKIECDDEQDLREQMYRIILKNRS